MFWQVAPLNKLFLVLYFSFEQSPVSTGVDPSHSQVNGHSCEAKSDAKKQHLLLLSERWGWSGKEALSSVSKEIAIQLAKNSQLQVSCLVAYTDKDLQGEAKEHGVQLVGVECCDGYTPVQCLAFPPDCVGAIDCVIGYGMVVGPHAQPIKKHQGNNCKWVHIVQSSENESLDESLCENANVSFALGDHAAEKHCSRLAWNEKAVGSFTPGIFSEFQKCKQTPGERNIFRVIAFYPSVKELADGVGYDIPAKAVGMLPKDRYHLICVTACANEIEEIKQALLQHGISRSQRTVYSHPKSLETLCKWFVQADLLIMPYLPSCDENFGLIGLQAISANLPVIVSNDTGLGKALTSLPFGDMCVVDSDQPEEWKRRIENVKQKERSQRLDEANGIRENYNKYYAWDKQCKTLLDEILA